MENGSRERVPLIITHKEFLFTYVLFERCIVVSNVFMVDNSLFYVVNLWEERTLEQFIHLINFSPLHVSIIVSLHSFLLFIGTPSFYSYRF